MRDNPTSLLLSIASRGVPFSSADGQAFVRLPNPATRGYYILPVRSRAYREWVFDQFYAACDSIPSAHAFHAILHHLEARASQNLDNQRLAVWRRVGARGPGLIPRQLLLDLADSDRQFVEISPTGWTVSTGENALFQTSCATVSLPVPVASDPALPLATLRSCLNLPSRAAWLCCLGWLLAAFRPSGPFPVLILSGPPASGKSFIARILRSLVDPSTSPLTPIPSSVRDLLTLARHNWVLAFDHISTLSPPLTDAICRLSSGLGASLRESPGYAPEPLQQYVRRPVLLTVTDRWSCPPDLAERSLTVTLPALLPQSRRTEISLLTVIQQAFPEILGALCSAVSTGLQRLPRMSLSSGRCPDALAWAMAASPALGSSEDEIRHSFDPSPHSSSPAPHPLVDAIGALLLHRGQWIGTASQLLRMMPPAASCPTPKDLSRQLRSCTLSLADSGIRLTFRRSREGLRLIELFQDPGDALDEKTPESASNTLDASPQSLETAELIPS